jgi:hypothetical protein
MDSIDKRNLQENMARSIVKRRNVIYNPQPVEAQNGEKPEGLAENGIENGQMEQGETPEEELTEAQNILKRLQEEADAEEAAKREAIEKLLAQQEEQKNDIDRILQEKQNDLERTMAQAKG